jgi:hypothetical protein
MVTDFSQAPEAFNLNRTSGNKREKMTTSSDIPQYVSPQINETYFGKFKINPSEVFLVTDFSYAFVNLKPVVPGNICTHDLSFVSLSLSLSPCLSRHCNSEWD